MEPIEQEVIKIAEVNDETMKNELIPKDLHDKNIANFAAFAKRFDGASYKKLGTRFLGYTHQELMSCFMSPHVHGRKLIEISNAIKRKSGFYERMISTLAKSALLHWHSGIIEWDERYRSASKKIVNKNFIKWNGEIARLELEKYIPEIFDRVFTEDAVFGFWVEEGYKPFLYFLPADWCEVMSTCNGGMLTYGIYPHKIKMHERMRLPRELRELVDTPFENERDACYHLVYPEPQKCFCLKYNLAWNFLFPPFFSIIGDIIDVDDYKELLKAKTEGDNFNVLGMKIPVSQTEQDKLMLTEKTVEPVGAMARNILPPNYGVLPTPMDLNAIQFKNTGVAERNTVQDAVQGLYDEAGIPKDLISSASSGSELDMAITNMSGMIFGIYRQIEFAINNKMKIQGLGAYNGYEFDFKILDITTQNKDKFANQELKMAQASTPNKIRLMASMGINPAQLSGIEYMENEILKLSSNWTPLRTSYTESFNVEVGESGGRPTNESIGETVTEVTETGIENGSNIPENRI